MNKKWVNNIMIIISGSFLYALSVNEFLIPHHLLNGGISGISIMIQYATGIPAGALMLAMNIPIFIIGVREIDREFIIQSFVGMVSSSLFMILLKEVQTFDFLRVDDTMLASIFGGVVIGIGSGIIFRRRGSLGGTDIIAVIVKKRRSINIGTVTFLMNVAIIFLASLLYGIKRGMFTLISMYVSAWVLDRVQEGLDRKKSVFIISEREDEVADAILKNLHRGVTFLYGEGAYTNNKKKIIYCIITTKQLAELKHIVRGADPRAFFTVSDTAEVLGRGFEKTGV